MAGQLLVAQPRGSGARLKETTAIPADPITEGEATAAGPGRSFLFIAVLLMAVLMTVLPVLAALWLVPGAGPTAAALAGLLAAVLGGLRVAVWAWGAVSTGGEPRFRAAISVND